MLVGMIRRWPASAAARLRRIRAPSPVLVFARQRVRIQSQGRRHHVLRMVADDIGVVFEVSQHLLKVALSVQGNKAFLHLVERVASPVERRGLGRIGPRLPLNSF